MKKEISTRSILICSKDGTFCIESKFESRFKIFKMHGEISNFIIKPDDKEEIVWDFQHFQYLKISFKNDLFQKINVMDGWV